MLAFGGAADLKVGGKEFLQNFAQQLPLAVFSLRISLDCWIFALLLHTPGAEQR